MRTTTSLIKKRGVLGDPLPTPFTNLQYAGFTWRRGQMCLIAAASGVGKSAFAHYVAMLMGVPTLYFSADSDSWTMSVRTWAIATGLTQDDVALELPGRIETGAIGDHGSHIQWADDPAPTLDYIEGQVAAYEEAHGEYPSLVIVDNLRNVAVRSPDDDTHPFALVQDKLHKLARNCGTHVMLLHHVVGAYEDGTQTVPLSGLEQKVSKIPEQVLTLSRDHETLTVSVVKNRTGKADPSGKWAVKYTVDLARMQFKERTSYG